MGWQSRQDPTTGESWALGTVKSLADFERFFQQGLELPLFSDVRVYPRDDAVLGRIGQDVDDLVGIPVLVEELHRLAGKPAHRHRFGALAVNQNFMLFDLLLDLFLDWIAHDASSPILHPWFRP